jgi:phage terminase Nu1 subunit (DNA packaging protein)
MKGIVTKAEFSRLVGVSRGRVSQWLTAGKIDGAALVRVGRSERIDVKEARRQLGRRLDIDQRLTKGSRSRISGVGGDTLEEIQRQRLEQLELANAQARELALARAGRYVEAADAKREMGRIAERLVASVEGGIPELASAIAGRFQLPPRDVLHALRTAWRGLRARLCGEADLARAETAPSEAAE